MTDKTADFTQGSILKKLVAFMLPVLGALILQAAYGAVDLLVVGRFGSTSGLSAVSTGSISSVFSDALIAALKPLRSCSGWNDISFSSTVLLSVSTNANASS